MDDDQQFLIYFCLLKLLNIFNKNLSQNNLMHKTSVPSFIPPSIFSLTKISNPSASITAEFSTLYDGNPEGSCSMTVPTFNQDGLYFTPSFYLRYDKKTLRRRVEEYWCAHEQRVADFQCERVKIMMPKPTKNNSYCTLCNQEFQDYLTHLESNKHQELLHKNQYRKMIEELCKTFSSNEKQKYEEEMVENMSKKRGKLSKTKQITKNISSLRESYGEESLKTFSPVIQPTIQA